MNTKNTKIWLKRSLCLMLGCLLAGAAFAAKPVILPDTTVASVIRIHTDTANSKLYAMISYWQPPCGTYKLYFDLEVDKGGSTTFHDNIKVKLLTSFSNKTDATAVHLEAGDTCVYGVNSGGFGIFVENLKSAYNIDNSDKLILHVRGETTPTKCVGCGPGGSTLLFTNKDIAGGCPDRGNREFVACHEVKTGYGRNFWEGWIQDGRDCKFYRVVQMPDKKWWMAQNLAAEQEDQADRNDMIPRFPPQTSTLRFPGDTIPLANDNDTVSSTLVNRETGLLYDNLSAVNIGCPQGWELPDYVTWKVMFDSVKNTKSPEGGDVNESQYRERNGGANDDPYIFEPTTTALHATDHLLLSSRLRATGTCPPANAFCNGYYNGNERNRPSTWPYYKRQTLGTDMFGFRIYPVSYWNPVTEKYYWAGGAYFWIGKTFAGDNPSIVMFRYDQGVVMKFESTGEVSRFEDGRYSVRCVESSSGAN
jgi:uncharacterized protein (TIGR02145 family)